MKILKGSCFCGGIKYEIHGPLEEVLNCHCSDCRKAHGAAFRTRASVNGSDFKFIEGENLLKEYRSKVNEARCFCSRCGSALFTRFDHSEKIGFALGTLDDDPEVAVGMHLFVSDKAPWYDIVDDLPQYDEFSG
ncbi:MAG: GFA family protein [Opitutaceae bacterium]|nr:GFA family protein [Opitutaceae bacterium]